MSNRNSFLRMGGIQLNREQDLPLYRQLYEYLREQILTGKLSPNTQLPATRTLAKELDISRNTVLNAYKQLIDEGYLESYGGGYTRVTHTLPEQVLTIDGAKTAAAQANLSENRPEKPPKLSKMGETIVELPYPYWDRSGSRPFSSSQPSVESFPSGVWEKCLLTSWRSIQSEELSYPNALGYRPLRKSLASYLQSTRGVNCTADQVVITNGTQHALSTIFTLLLNKGDEVWVENPSYNGVKIALTQVEANIIPVNIDDQGLIFEEGFQQSPNGRMACISPSHQYPLGATMSLTRRLELLDWAERNEAWIIEDDYDSEYRYSGYPIEALQGLDKAGRVIYMGTFSKVLFPALRLGYMILPKSLVEPYRAARAFSDRGTRILEQVTVYHFIEEGHLGRHIRKMRTLYAERQEVLIEMAHKFLGGMLELEPNNVGLHLVGWLPAGMDDDSVSKHLLADGIYAPPLSYFSLTPLPRPGLIMGYAAIPANDIVSAVKQMSWSLRKLF